MGQSSSSRSCRPSRRERSARRCPTGNRPLAGARGLGTVAPNGPVGGRRLARRNARMRRRRFLQVVTLVALAAVALGPAALAQSDDRGDDVVLRVGTILDL